MNKQFKSSVALRVNKKVIIQLVPFYKSQSNPTDLLEEMTGLSGPHHAAAQSQSPTLVLYKANLWCLHCAGKCLPAESTPWREQQGDHGVAQALTEGAQELPILYIIASVQAQSLLPSLLFSLNGIKIPSQSENRGCLCQQEVRASTF